MTRAQLATARSHLRSDVSERIAAATAKDESTKAKTGKAEKPHGDAVEPVWADEKINWIENLWMPLTPAPALDSYLDAGDLIEVLQPALGSMTRKYSEIRRNLSSFAKFNPNPLVMGLEGDAPKRKVLVTKVHSAVGNLKAQLRRVAYLKQFGKLSMVVLDVAEMSCEAYWDVRKLSQEKLERLYVESVKVGCDRRCGLRGWKAVMPGAPVETGRAIFTELCDLGLVKDDGHLARLGSKRNFVLWKA